MSILTDQTRENEGNDKLTISQKLVQRAIQSETPEDLMEIARELGMEQNRENAEKQLQFLRELKATMSKEQLVKAVSGMFRLDTGDL